MGSGDRVPWVLAQDGYGTEACAMAGSGVLAFIGPDGNVWTMSANGGSKRRITTDGTPEAPYAAPSWSRDGRGLMSIRQDPPALAVFDLLNFSPRAVATGSPVLAAWG